MPRRSACGFCYLAIIVRMLQGFYKNQSTKHYQHYPSLTSVQPAAMCTALEPGRGRSKKKSPDQPGESNYRNLPSKYLWFYGIFKKQQKCAHDMGVMQFRYTALVRASRRCRLKQKKYKLLQRPPAARPLFVDSANGDSFHLDMCCGRNKIIIKLWKYEQRGSSHLPGIINNVFEFVYSVCFILG